MKKINLQKIVERLVKNLSLVFFAAFLILLVFEAFEINSSVQLILKGKEPGKAPKLDKSARINFDSYNEVVNRIQQGDSFKPTGGISRDPFNAGLAPAGPSPAPGPQGSTNPATSPNPSPTPGSSPSFNDSSGVLQIGN